MKVQTCIPQETLRVASPTHSTHPRTIPLSSLPSPVRPAPISRAVAATGPETNARTGISRILEPPGVARQARTSGARTGIRGYPGLSSRIRSAAFSAIITVGAFVFPPISRGMTEASTTLSPATPRTRRLGSTTAISSRPIRQVPTG